MYSFSILLTIASSIRAGSGVAGVDQFGIEIGIPFRYSRMDTTGGYVDK